MDSPLDGSGAVSLSIICIIDDHSSELPVPTGMPGSSGGGSSNILPRERGNVEEWTLGGGKDEETRKFQSGDLRDMESREVDRIEDKSSPSSVTSSPPNVPHSTRRVLSTGVPRPTCLTNGQEPRITVAATEGDIISALGDNLLVGLLLPSFNECDWENREGVFDDLGVDS